MKYLMWRSDVSLQKLLSFTATEQLQRRFSTLDVLLHTLFHHSAAYDFSASLHVGMKLTTHTLAAGTRRAIWGGRHLLLTLTRGEGGEYVSVCERNWRWACDSGEK